MGLLYEMVLKKKKISFPFTQSGEKKSASKRKHTPNNAQAREQIYRTAASTHDRLNKIFLKEQETCKLKQASLGIGCSSPSHR